MGVLPKSREVRVFEFELPASGLIGLAESRSFGLPA